MTKKLLAAGLLLVASSAPFFSAVSPYYPISLSVVLVATSEYGYVVGYRVSFTTVERLYIPASWFLPEGRATLVQGEGPEYPALTVFMEKKGDDWVFHHLKLYLPRSVAHSDIVYAPSSEELKAKFEEAAKALESGSYAIKF